MVVGIGATAWMLLPKSGLAATTLDWSNAKGKPLDVRPPLSPLVASLR
jgi:hypothetical protein